MTPSLEQTTPSFLPSVGVWRHVAGSEFQFISCTSIQHNSSTPLTASLSSVGRPYLKLIVEMELYPQENLLVRLGGTALSRSDVQAFMSHSPHGPELMRWLNDTLSPDAKETGSLLQKYVLEEEENNM